VQEIKKAVAGQGFLRALEKESQTWGSKELMKKDTVKI